jgi:tyrosine-protein phosphatase SIW14
MRLLRQIKLLAVLVLVLASIPAWAGGMNAQGVPNFYQVNDHVYRGAQPSDEGWKTLATLGVKTVIDLRLKNEHPTEAEQQAVEAAGMHYINIPMNGLIAPADEQVSRVLALLDSTKDGPVFVHCRRGADRTGTVIACYRIAHDHWQNKKALSEAKSAGMSWIEIGMKHYVQSYAPPTESATATLQPAAVHP